MIRKLPICQNTQYTVDPLLNKVIVTVLQYIGYTFQNDIGTNKQTKAGSYLDHETEF